MRFIAWFCFLLSAGAAWSAPLALELGANEAALRPLFDALAQKGAVRAPFTERRWFPFRKQPVQLSGEIRFSPERGLSLRYTAPEEKLMVIDDHGILLRDARGRSRALKPDARLANFDEALLPVLSFDLPRLERHFTLAASLNSDGWRVELTPRDATLARTLGNLTIEGTDTAIRRLEFKRSAQQRVEILVGETQTGVTFTADELKRFFR